MFDVDAYLPDFLTSVAAQDSTGVDLQVIFVDDGSPDSSGRIARSWLTSSGTRGQVITQVNAGVSAARNAGLAAASGDWVAFPDPDDVLAPGYLASVRDFVRSDPARELDLVATRLVVFRESERKITDSHLLRYRFNGGTRIADLDKEPAAFHMHASSTFFRVSALRASDVQFVPGLPLSEDSVFIQTMLLRTGHRHVGYLAEAEYIYRKRARGDSAIDGSATSPAAYVQRFELGYKPLVESVPDGYVPSWLAFVILYELTWLLRAETRARTRSRFLSRDQKARFIELVTSCVRRIDPADIAAFGASPHPYPLRLLLFALAGIDARAEFDNRVTVTRPDRRRGLMRLSYFHVGAVPAEHIVVDGRAVSPLFAKRRGLNFFDQHTLYERVAWIPLGSAVEVELDGVAHEVTHGGISTPRCILEQLAPTEAVRAASRPAPRLDQIPVLSTWIPQAVASTPSALRPARRAVGRVKRRSLKLLRQLRRRAGRWRRSLQTQRLGSRAASAPAIGRFRDAWVFMDRVTAAGDNAEHLYRFVRQRHPEVNAWFVLSKEHAPDWARLESEGFRLVDYGSDDHVALMLNAAHYLSSQIDVNVIDPIGKGFYKSRPWQFTFLQHGVTQHDLSDWFNTKDVDLFLTVTPREHEAFVSDESPYNLTEKECVRTGFPRHDALLEKRKAALEEGGRRLVVFAPTWRDSLLSTRKGANSLRLAIDEFAESSYVAAWRGAVCNETVATLAAQDDVDVLFLPHPGFQDNVAAFELPEHVGIIQYSTVDIQEVLAHAALVVTDYSSLAFDAAAVGVPVVYYQFDREAVYTGNTHFVVRGYFDFFADGFGPVAETLEEFEMVVRQLIDNGFVRADEYSRRSEEAFDRVDGAACERVVSAVRALGVDLGTWRTREGT